MTWWHWILLIVGIEGAFLYCWHKVCQAGDRR